MYYKFKNILLHRPHVDILPEWSKGVDSSSTSASCVGSNPTGVNVLSERIKIYDAMKFHLYTNRGTHTHTYMFRAPWNNGGTSNVDLSSAALPTERSTRQRTHTQRHPHTHTHTHTNAHTNTFTPTPTATPHIHTRTRKPTHTHTRTNTQFPIPHYCNVFHVRSKCCGCLRCLGVFPHVLVRSVYILGRWLGFDLGRLQRFELVMCARFGTDL